MKKTESGPYILHLCPRQFWESALKSGEYRPPSLEKEGFIHCSLEHQILGVANQFYRGVPDLVLLWIDPGKVESNIIFEGPPGESGELFPHIYGALNSEAVLSVEAFPIQEDGFFHSVPQPSEWLGGH